jgi:hypothetical protein
MHEAGSSAAVMGGAVLAVVASAYPVVFGLARFESESSEHATGSAAAATRAISAVVRGT